MALSPKFDLRKSYFLIAGIAGISPKHGTLGTTAWAHYLVEFGTQWELDSRDAPKDWPTGYLGINTKGPNEKPPLDYKTEVFELNPKLQAKAFALSQKVELTESKESAAWRKHYPHDVNAARVMPAQHHQPGCNPAVLRQYPLRSDISRQRTPVV